jgi:hypothetical protein
VKPSRHQNHGAVSLANPANARLSPSPFLNQSHGAENPANHASVKQSQSQHRNHGAESPVSPANVRPSQSPSQSRGVASPVSLAKSATSANSISVPIVFGINDEHSFASYDIFLFRLHVYTTTVYIFEYLHFFRYGLR